MRDRVDIVVVGISTGGPDALAQVVPKLASDFPVGIVVVQHIPKGFAGPLAESLDRASELEVRKAEHGDQVRPGRVLIAPGGSQLKLVGGGDSVCVRLTDDPPVRDCKPSADYLFESAARIFGARTLGLVMTGMGDDGTDGCRHIKEAGGQVFIQDEATSVVFGMARCVEAAGLADSVISLPYLAARLTQATRRKELT